MADGLTTMVKRDSAGQVIDSIDVDPATVDAHRAAGYRLVNEMLKPLFDRLTFAERMAAITDGVVVVTQ